MQHLPDGLQRKHGHSRKPGSGDGGVIKEKYK